MTNIPLRREFLYTQLQMIFKSFLRFPVPLLFPSAGFHRVTHRRRRRRRCRPLRVRIKTRGMKRPRLSIFYFSLFPSSLFPFSLSTSRLSLNVICTYPFIVDLLLPTVLFSLYVEFLFLTCKLCARGISFINWYKLYSIITK